MSVLRLQLTNTLTLYWPRGHEEENMAFLHYVCVCVCVVCCVGIITDRLCLAVRVKRDVITQPHWQTGWLCQCLNA